MDTARTTTTKGISNLLFDADPARVAQQSLQNPFDVIVIGSGMGGGVLAHSLADAKQRVLLLERGDLLFTTHALNTTRPHPDFSKSVGPTQDNDIVYSLLKETVKLTDESDPWTGGPLYCLGGRSNAWGLFIPRVDSKTMKEYFPASVAADLVDNDDPKRGNYYKRAEYMMHNKNYKHDRNIGTVPLDHYDRVRMKVNSAMQDKNLSADKRKELEEILTAALKREGSEAIEVKPITDVLKKEIQEYSSRHSDILNTGELHWALLGAQFTSEDRYEFPQGAFSTTDRILEAVFRSHKTINNKMQPTYLTVLHNTLVMDLILEKDVVRKVKTINASGLQHSFYGKKIVLCAGTIDSPALLLRSGIETQPTFMKGTKPSETTNNTTKEVQATPIAKYTGVTDHNIYGFRFILKGGGDVEAAKLQLEGEVIVRTEPTPDGKREGGDAKTFPFLLNLCINANSFLARGYEEEDIDHADGVCVMAYEFRAPINHNNFVALDVYTGQPIVHIKNSGEEALAGGKINPQIERTLNELNIFIEQTIRKAVNKNDSKSQLRENSQAWKPAGLGCVAHEIGTLPMHDDPKYGVVDANLKFHNLQNLFACDMSVMPVSAPANPSLTLVALALRLADHIVTTSTTSTSSSV